MSDPSSGRRFRGSLGVSTLMHLVAVALIVPVVATGTTDYGRIGDARKATESVTLATLTIEHRAHIIPHRAPVRASTRRVRSVPAATAAPKLRAHRASPPVAPPVRSAAKAGPWRSIVAHVSRMRVPVAVLVSTAAPERAANSSAATRHPSLPSPSPLATASALATATASPAPEERRVADSGADVPFGGWGQSFEKPLVADDAALSALRAKFHGTAPIVVAVNESGHATSISLPDGLSADARADLERRLRELRYVPAECNGLRCDGTLELTL
jgi:hypothetical protein